MLVQPFVAFSARGVASPAPENGSERGNATNTNRTTTKHNSNNTKYTTNTNSNTTKHIRKGTNGVSTNGATADFMFFDRDFLGTHVNLLLSPQQCQGMHFVHNLSEFMTFAAAPLVLTPFVPFRI